MGNEKTIFVKYNGKKIPTLGGKQIFPGNQSVDYDAFMAMVKNPCGARDLKNKTWQIIEEKSDKKIEPKTKAENFSALPVAKQKEFVSECFVIDELKELADIPAIGKSTAKAIGNRVEEIESDFNFGNE